MATLKKTNENGFQDLLSLNAGQKYCRMFQKGAFCNTFDLHYAPVDIETFVLSIVELPFGSLVWLLCILAPKAN